MGGKGGRIYVVTDPGDEPMRPSPGTLRYGLVQDEPLWIVFHRDMTIRPKGQLVVSSHKTVDGRGARIVVGEGGACFAVNDVSNVIIHGITIRNCRPKPKGAATHHNLSSHSKSNGDGVSINHSRDVWIDRCTCRFGVFHIVNNDYVNWEMYAIGGSASPTILSYGNRFHADREKEVTRRNDDAPASEWRSWAWISNGDLMLNGALFTPSGRPGPELIKAPSFAKPASLVAKCVRVLLRD
uniref:Uncharacterized protein n=1 Tax=Avena sativa TaxID=4498 RepID=A0ACD5ZIY3_AVESA